MTTRRWWHRAYALALRAFPAAFRDAWGDDMRATFAARIARSDSPRRLLARELPILAAAGLAERLHATLRQPRMLHLRDLRYALRLLARSPGFTLLTVVVLAGGLGLSTFTFSFLHTAMIRALPLPEGARIVRVDPVVDGRRTPVDATDLPALRASLRSLRDLGGYGGREVVLGRAGDGRVVDATVADPALFTVARTPALYGRTLLPADAEPGAEPVIVLAYRTWEAAFGADPGVLGAPVVIDGTSTRVVGVMPRGFGFPVAAEAWLPLPAGALAAREHGLTPLRLVARLAPGVTHAAAAAEAGPVLRRLAAARDTSARAVAVSAAVESFPAVQFGEERALVFTTLNVLAGMILLLALVNVTNLLLARANERVRETAVRLALGATTGRLAVQGMWETVLLCLAGGALGTLGAAWGLDAVTRWTRANMEENLAFWWVWRMDRVGLLGAGAFITVAVAVLAGVVALRTARTNVREVMQDGSARAGSRRVGRLSRVLVATQVATVTVLMFFGVMAGVMARRVLALDPGFPTAQLLQGGVYPPAARWDTPARRAAVLRDVHARLAEREELDGVLLRTTLADHRSPGGRFALRAGGSGTAYVVAALGDLETVGSRILEGRAFTPSDDASQAPVAIVSRALARAHWRGGSPIGDQVQVTVAGRPAWATIVGVADDVMHGDPLSRERSADAVWIPLLQAGVDGSAFVVRWKDGEVAARQALRAAFASVDPLLVPDTVQPFDEVLRKLGLITTSVSRLFAACFAFALLLALAGTFGLMSRAIGLRTREVGVRRALGASDASVTRLLLAQGGRQLGVGALAAAPLLVAVGVAFTRWFPIAAWIPAAAALLVPAAVVGLILGATWLPTRGVLRLTPREALWKE